jgi:hypothetical protein
LAPQVDLVHPLDDVPHRARRYLDDGELGPFNAHAALNR